MRNEDEKNMEGERNAKSEEEHKTRKVITNMAN